MEFTDPDPEFTWLDPNTCNTISEICYYNPLCQKFVWAMRSERGTTKIVHVKTGSSEGNQRIKECFWAFWEVAVTMVISMNAKKWAYHRNLQMIHHNNLLSWCHKKKTKKKMVGERKGFWCTSDMLWLLSSAKEFLCSKNCIARCIVSLIWHLWQTWLSIPHIIHDIEMNSKELSRAPGWYHPSADAPGKISLLQKLQVQSCEGETGKREAANKGRLLVRKINGCDQMLAELTHLDEICS